MTEQNGVERSTAIDELCQLLDERNEEYDIRDNSGGMPSYVMVCWFFNLADRAYFYGYPDGHTKLVTYRYVYDLTPEQAIAATLGPGTCHVECFDDGIDEALDGSPIYTTPTWHLSCGHTEQGSERPSFCPVCGKAVDE